MNLMNKQTPCVMISISECPFLKTVAGATDCPESGWEQRQKQSGPSIS